MHQLTSFRKNIESIIFLTVQSNHGKGSRKMQYSTNGYKMIMLGSKTNRIY